MPGVQHGGTTDQTEQTGPTVQPTLDDLINRSNVLLSELEALQTRLRESRQEGNVELSHFRGMIRSEKSMLERLSNRPEDHAKAHIAKSSNLPFLETLWKTVKKSKNLVALQKRVYMTSATRALSQRMGQLSVHANTVRPKGGKGDSVIVDAIVDGGLTWIKVSLVTNSRLLFDLAKQGWESDGPYSDDEKADQVFNKPPNPDDDDDDNSIPLVKSAKELARAVQCFRIRTRTPQVQLILPRVHPNETPEIDKILFACRETGGLVFTAPDLQSPSPALPDALQTMCPDPFEAFSSVLNIDCTILLALVSEFSHARVSKEPWFHAALNRQVEIEGNENMLPALLYPAMSSRPLVCTHEAVARMREIVDTIGTPSEKARTKLLLGDDGNKSREQLISEMQTWSAHVVPKDWQLPIRPISREDNEAIQVSSLPEEARLVCKEMTAINRSVFCYGWARGITTITSNRTVVKQIRADLEKNFEHIKDEVWPNIWLCPTARSLVGKEKRGARQERPVTAGEDTDEGDASAGPKKTRARAWPLPDPLRREEQRRNGLDVLSKRSGYEVEDLRPNGYDYEDVIKAKNASVR